jgi:hypothetical protein
LPLVIGLFSSFKKESEASIESFAESMNQLQEKQQVIDNLIKIYQVNVELSKTDNQTHEIKRAINKSITNTGHGSLFLGSSTRLEGGDKNIRLLVGAHFARHGKLKIGVFGGKCDPDEMTIDTVIRETIEEVFNFPASLLMIHHIRYFLNENPDFYYILALVNKAIIWGGNYFADKLPINNDWLCWHKKNDGLSFRLIYNKKPGYTYNFKVHIKIQA